MGKGKVRPKTDGGALKNYTKGNKAMTPRQQYKLSKQSNRYGFKENTAQIRAGTQKSLARTGIGGAAATSSADSLSDATQETKKQQDQNIYIYDSAAQGFLPTTSEPGQIMDSEQMQGKTSAITPEGLEKSL